MSSPVYQWGDGQGLILIRTRCVSDGLTGIITGLNYVEYAVLVNWPGIIKYADDDELIYIADQARWDSDAELYASVYDDSDCLIDSDGHIYRLTGRINDRVSPAFSGESMALLDILGLIKGHAAQSGSCCVAKLYAPTIHDAFVMLASFNDM